MSENENKRMMVCDPREPLVRMIDEQLTRPATITHPTMRGDLQKFRTVIEKVYFREDEEDGKMRLCCRGKAEVDGWSGYKTFFAEDCISIIDEYGNNIDDISNWMLKLVSTDPACSPRTVACEISEKLGKMFCINNARLILNMLDSGLLAILEDENSVPLYIYKIECSLLVDDFINFDTISDRSIIYISVPEVEGDLSSNLRVVCAVEVVPCERGRVEVRDFPVPICAHFVR